MVKVDIFLFLSIFLPKITYKAYRQKVIFMEKDQLVVKHNSLINLRTKHKYNTNELKFICKQISMIRPDYKNLDDEIVNPKDLGFSDKEMTNYKYIREFFEELYCKKFYLPGTDRLIGWFSSLEYKDGLIYYSMDERLKPFLLQLKRDFTSYYVSNVLKLKSSYSIGIYELLQQNVDWNVRTQEFWRDIKIDDLKELLHIPKSYNISNIEKRVIQKAQSDLEKNTDLKFEYFPEKKGRSFHSIKFKIIKNKK